MTLRPLADHIIIEMIEEEGITRHGLILTAGSKKMPTFARVIAVGENVTAIREGDKILTERYAGSNITIDRDTHYLSIKENQVLCIVEDDEEEKGE